MGARDYRELACYQLAHELKLKVYAFTATAPAARDFTYCHQIRTSTRSAAANIAEGFGRYRPAEFARYLEIARGSLLESRNHLEDGLDLGYLTTPECGALCRLCNRAVGATTRLLLYLRRSRTSSEPPAR